MKGRIPKPSALKLLQGNPGHRKIDTRAEPQAVIGLGEPPSYLDLEARRFWFQSGEQLVGLGTLGESDAPLFAELCQLHSRNLYLSAKIAAFRRVKILSSAAERKLDKLEGQRLKVSSQFIRCSAEFGIGAASRTRIRVKPDADQTSFGFDSEGNESAFAKALRLANS